MEPHAQHRATRIHEADRLTERRIDHRLGHLRLGRQALLSVIVEKVEHVQEEPG
jgi:hypothetical protein